MADSIPLSNAHLLKGLMPDNPHRLVPVESLTASPTSSTGSASVLEWNSNSDSELFQMSSPASAAALTAQASSPLFSTFSTTPSPVGSSSSPRVLVDSHYIVNWPKSTFGSSLNASPAPTSNDGSPPGTIADIDNVPALNEHPEELNVLIERMFLTDLSDTVSKWQSEASNISPVGAATLESSSSSNASLPLDTPADMSMTSTVLGCVHYDHLKDEKVTTATVSPPRVSLFDAPSPARSAEASIISIAEYFKRKASERAAPSAGTDQQIDTAPEERPASANSVLSYFSPSSSPVLRQSTAPGSVRAPSPRSDLFRFWDASPQMEQMPNHVSSPSIVSDDRGSNFDVEEQQRDSLPTEVQSNPSSGVHSPALAYPYTSIPSSSFRYFNRHTAPISGPIIVEQRTSISQSTAPRASANHNSDISSTSTAVPAGRYNSGICIVPRISSPDSEAGTAVKDTAANTSERPVRETAYTIPMWLNSAPPMPIILTDRPPSPPSPTYVPYTAPLPAQNNMSAGNARKPRPPLPAVPTAKPPVVPPPPVIISEESPMRERLTTPFAKAYPSAWTCSDFSPMRYGSPPTPVLASTGDAWGGNWGRSTVASPLTDSSWNTPRLQPVKYDYHCDPQGGSVHFGSGPTRITNYHPFESPLPPMAPTPPMPPMPPSMYYTGPTYTPPFGPPPPLGQPFSPPQNYGACLFPPREPERHLRFVSPPSSNNSWSRPSAQRGSLSPPPVTIPNNPAQHWTRYNYSSPAPVIPPNSSHGGGWYAHSMKYSFKDASVSFRVETILFDVHRHFFERHSEYFRKLLSTYRHFEGNHVFLPEVKKVDFERLLSIFYPTDLNTPDITTLKGWTSILTLAQKWDMAQLRVLAVQNIGDQAWPIEKIIIAHQHNLHNPGPAWLLPAYKAICGRATPLTLQEAEQLDMKTVIRIWEVQHEVKAMGGVRGPQEDERIGELVKEKFGTFESTERPAPRAPPMW